MEVGVYSPIRPPFRGGLTLREVPGFHSWWVACRAGVKGSMAFLGDYRSKEPKGKIAEQCFRKDDSSKRQAVGE